MEHETIDDVQRSGYKKGDVVALFMENSIEFVACWLGLAKLGVVTAWVNSSLKMEQLAHCIRTSRTTAVITSRSLAQGLAFCIMALMGEDVGVAVLLDTRHAGHSLATSKTVEKQLRLFVAQIGDDDATDSTQLDASCTDLSAALATESPAEPPVARDVDFRSLLCYIYTSGTTGLPKAAVIRHHRYYGMAGFGNLDIV